MDEIDVSARAAKLAVGEKEEPFHLRDRDDRFLVLRDDLDVAAPEERLFQDLPADTRRRAVPGDDDAVQRRLHGARGNGERLEKIGPHRKRDDDGDEEDLHVFAPGGVLRRLRELAARLVEALHLRVDLLAVFLLHRVLEVRDLALDVQQRLLAHQIAFVGDQLAGVLDELAPVFEVARSEWEHAAVGFGAEGLRCVLERAEVGKGREGFFVLRSSFFVLRSRSSFSFSFFFFFFFFCCRSRSLDFKPARTRCPASDTLPVIKAVIFDIDGTLVDSVDFHAEAWQRAFAKFGKEISFEKIRGQIGKGGDQLLPVFWSKEELERIEEPLTKYRTELITRSICRGCRRSQKSARSSSSCWRTGSKWPSRPPPKERSWGRTRRSRGSTTWSTPRPLR